MRFRLMPCLACLAVAGTGVAAGASGNPWAPYPRLEPLRVKISGHCEGAPSDRITIHVLGLTPLGSYRWAVWYPDGKRVSFADSFPNGTIGITPKSRVAILDDNCQGSKPGRYRLVVTDNVTGQHVACSYIIAKATPQ